MFYLVEVNRSDSLLASVLSLLDLITRLVAVRSVYSFATLKCGDTPPRFFHGHFKEKQTSIFREYAVLKIITLRDKLSVLRSETSICSYARPVQPCPIR